MDFRFSVITFVYSMISDGFLFFVVILGVSRFKIFKQKYFRVPLTLPFYFSKNKDEDFVFPFLNIPIKVRGENYQEHILTKYLNRTIEICPFAEKGRLLKNLLTNAHK